MMSSLTSGEKKGQKSAKQLYIHSFVQSCPSIKTTNQIAPHPSSLSNVQYAAHANGLGMFIVKTQHNTTSSDTRDIFEREKTRGYKGLHIDYQTPPIMSFTWASAASKSPNIRPSSNGRPSRGTSLAGGSKWPLSHRADMGG